MGEDVDDGVADPDDVERGGHERAFSQRVKGGGSRAADQRRRIKGGGV
jgi:hypothetical protein